MFTRSDVKEIASSLPGFNGDARLIAVGEQHYVVSAVNVPFYGSETLVFPADRSGAVTDWMDIAGVHEWGHEAAISDLLEYLNQTAERGPVMNNDNDVQLEELRDAHRNDFGAGGYYSDEA